MITSNISITGNLVNAYFVCKRKCWLYARQFNPDPQTDLLLFGRIITEETYKRNKKEIQLEGMKIDLLKKENGQTLVCEVKKSSKMLQAAMMQLAFYLKKLKKEGIILEGEILIPKERKRIPLKLSDEIEQKLNDSILQIRKLLKQDIPPPAEKKTSCRNCAFNDFCWA